MAEIQEIRLLVSYESLNDEEKSTENFVTAVINTLHEKLRKDFQTRYEGQLRKDTTKIFLKVKCMKTACESRGTNPIDGYFDVVGIYNAYEVKAEFTNFN